MIKVFVGGSPTVTRLGGEVRRRLDEITERRLPVLAGNASGVDKTVQQHSRERQHSQVEVFFMEGLCRNNVGPWTIRLIPARSSEKDFGYYPIRGGPPANLKGGNYWFPLTPG
jgi:hypothetical protein